jgi:hypothetical protein
MLALSLLSMPNVNIIHCDLKFNILIMESAQGSGGSARLMSSIYNEAVVEWSIKSQNESDFRECVQ